MTTQTKTTHTPDIDMAEKNFIEIKGGKIVNWSGSLANKLMNSPDFKPCPFSFSVWEITGDTYDPLVDASKFVGILRANQSTLSGALMYMRENRVMIHNQDYPEKDAPHITPSEFIKAGYQVTINEEFDWVKVDKLITFHDLNKNLIAAADELLEALKAIHKAANNYCDNASHAISQKVACQSNLGHDMINYAHIVDLASKAIAKADGRDV